MKKKTNICGKWLLVILILIVHALIAGKLVERGLSIDIETYYLSSLYLYITIFYGLLEFAFIVYTLVFIISLISKKFRKKFKANIKSYLILTLVMFLPFFLSNFFITLKISESKSNARLLINSIETFKIQNQHYPRYIKELVPNYIISLPKTSNGQNFFYSNNNSTYTLSFSDYSLMGTHYYSSERNEWEWGD